MSSKRLLSIFAYVILSCCLCSNLVVAKKLIVVLVDGVRWDYIDDPSLKGIHRIIDNGVKAKYVVPIFPSFSYPNWYTLVTGLYSENHGFVANHMYDNDTNTFFNMIPEPGSTDPHWWNDAEPLWVTAEKNDSRSALYWWGGCEVEIAGTHPTICERQLSFPPPTLEGKMDFLERIDDVVEMFKPSKRFPEIDRLSLALMYYGSVDTEGHHSGTNSNEVKAALRDIDSILDAMQSKIKDAGLQNEVNIMVVSDHGMTDETSATKYISLEKYASRIKYQLEYGGVSMIVPQPQIIDTLVKEMQSEEGLLVYKKEDIPEKYHYKNNKKISPILLVAKKGYLIKKIEDHLINDSTTTVGGASDFKGQHGHHGHDPEEVDDMRTVFFATGPDFKKGFVTEVLYNTDFYNVMCHVLQIDPLPNNGSWERVQSMLEEKPQPAPMGNSYSVSSRNQIILILTSFTMTLSLLLFLYLRRRNCGVSFISNSHYKLLVTICRTCPL